MRLMVIALIGGLAFTLLSISVVVWAVGRMLVKLRAPLGLMQGRSLQAPIWWRWSPSAAAVLHRRLESATVQAEVAWERLNRAGRSVQGLPLHSARQLTDVGRFSKQRYKDSKASKTNPADPWTEPLREMVVLATEVDRILVRAQRANSTLKGPLALELEEQVLEVEGLCRRFCLSIDQRLDRAGHDGMGHHIRERLDALDEAAERLGGPEPLPAHPPGSFGSIGTRRT